MFDYHEKAPQLSKALATSVIYSTLRRYAPHADEEWLREIAYRAVAKTRTPPKTKGPSHMEPPWWFKYGGMPTL